MNLGQIHPGDSLICCGCDHERVVSAEWISTICGRHFPDRMPSSLFDSDLGRFRCPKCGSKKLLRRAKQTQVALRPGKPDEAAWGRQFLTSYLDQAKPHEISALQAWATQLVALRATDSSPLFKAKRAIILTIESGAVLPFITFLGSELKRIGWDERGLPERLALSAAAAAALVFSGHGAGIAALGGAIGVPLWVVFGAGGAFAGLLIEEAKRRAAALDDDKSERTNGRGE